MRYPLTRRAIYSFLTTLACLSLIYYLLAIFPNPRMWLANARADNGMLVQAVVMAILYGLPAWALAYLFFGLLDIPKVDHRGRAARTPPR